MITLFQFVVIVAVVCIVSFGLGIFIGKREERFNIMMKETKEEN